MGADYYPHNMSDKADWHVNYATQLAALTAKYNITSAQLQSVEDDSAWMTFWVTKRVAANAFASQLAVYFNSIAGNDPSLDLPEFPQFILEDGPQVPPGIEFRVREIARHIKGHSSYAEADGTVLGIVGDDVGSASAPKPEIQVFPAASNYMFSIVVSKRGQSDSWQVWARPLGDPTFKLAATATGKSTDVQLSPTGEVPAPAQYDVRVQLRRSNEDYGEVSDNAQVVVVP